MKNIVLLCWVTLVAACATAPTDITLNAADSAAETNNADAKPLTNEAILITAVGPIAVGGHLQFQRLNEAKTDFADSPVVLGFGAWGVGDKMKRAKGDGPSIWALSVKPTEINFLIKKVEAGMYAANYVTWNTFNGVSSGTVSSCLNEGAATYEISAGTINIVSSKDAFPRGSMTRIANSVTDDQILEQFERTRFNYPELQGEPVLIRPILETRWKEGKSGFLSDGCTSSEPGSMFVTSLVRSDEAQAPDDADKAAIAAALKNIGLKGEETKPMEGEK